MTDTLANSLPSHGTMTRYNKHKCRCDACKKASRDYARNRDRLKAYGRWEPLVDAQPVRDHLAALSEAGIGWMRAARLAGLNTGTVSFWLYGGKGYPPARRIKAEAAAKLLAVSPIQTNLADRAAVDATGTRRRLQALIAVGYPVSELARRCGRDSSNFHNVLHQPRVEAATARAVEAVYDQLWNAAPEDNGVGSLYANLARALARRNGWPPPQAWDDDHIDDPNAEPSGHLPARRRAADLVEDAEFIQATTGVSIELAAERLGVPRNTLDRARERIAARARTADPP